MIHQRALLGWLIVGVVVVDRGQLLDILVPAAQLSLRLLAGRLQRLLQQVAGIGGDVDRAGQLGQHLVGVGRVALAPLRANGREQLVQRGIVRHIGQLVAVAAQQLLAQVFQQLIAREAAHPG